MNDNGIISSLDNMDRSITMMLNFDGGPIQDDIWIIFSSRLIWVIPALALIGYMLYHKSTRKKTIIVVLALALIVTLCDQTTSTLMKPYFARLRPSHTPGVMNMLHYVDGYRGGLYGFASSHAANSFGAVTFVALLMKRMWVTVSLFILSMCVCYSRIYMGVHYFGDIFVGALIGCMFGFMVYNLFVFNWSAIYERYVVRT